MKDQKIGISCYEKKKPKATYKHIPEEFVVREVVEGKILPLVEFGQPFEIPVIGEKTRFIKLNLTKKEYSTPEALAHLTKILGGRVKISCHGMKDKNALTSQLIAVPIESLESLRNFQNETLGLQFQDVSNDPLLLGKNDGNFFRIHLRTDIQEIQETIFEKVPNFFGVQRFGGTNRGIIVGKSILEGNWELAQKKCGYRSALNKALVETSGDIKQAFFHQSMRRHSKWFVQQWQSFLFNQLLSKMLVENHPFPAKIPMWSLRNKNLYKMVWDPKTFESDVNILIPNKNTNRSSFINVDQFSVENYKGRLIIEFQLPSGSYATTFLSHMFDLQPS